MCEHGALCGRSARGTRPAGVRHLQLHDLVPRRPAAARLCQGAIGEATGGRAMAVFVLVHGAWHGGWCYRRVADRLVAAGHRVFTPTLTGLGERAHLLSPAVNRSTHVQDVVSVIKWEGLKEVILVGHSYGGFVISEVVERVP